MILRVLNEKAGYPAPRSQLERILTNTWKRRGRGCVTLNLLLVDDQRMCQMARWVGHRRVSTDVLAFPDAEPDQTTGFVHLGDIAANVDVARQQAKQRGLRIRDEVTLYALHGLLHLLGMEDHTEAGRQAMVQAQEEIFRKHGLMIDDMSESG